MWYSSLTMLLCDTVREAQWSSLHFAYCISYEQMMKLKRLDRLYLELTLEGIGPEGNKELEGQK